MRSSWLVQRLEKPRQITIAGKSMDNPFSFGGGLRNGGLSEEAMKLIREIFSFDYMGAAEFEFGALPKTLQKMAGDHDKMVATSFEIPLKDVTKNWQDKSKKDPEGSATVYVLCRQDDYEEVESRIREWATGKEELKCQTNLSSTLRPYHEWDGETVGWLELDNGFMFFTDKEMWEKTADLFSVETKVSE